MTGVAIAAEISQIELRSNILTAFCCNCKIIKNVKLFVFLRHLETIYLYGTIKIRKFVCIYIGVKWGKAGILKPYCL